jgi:D-alanyl-D-alanine carboxypeptidase (penicillin-binding protein 5/6)
VGVQLSPVRRGLLLLALAAAFVSAAPHASAQPAPPADATSVLVANAATGEVLLARNADSRVAIASITKLMTALVALDHARPGDMVTVGPLASTVGESSVELRRGERISVRDLLAAALIQSANDAAFALAAHVGQGDVPRFVRLMNAKARELGLADTRFVRPDGLDVPGHHSSAEDVLALARAAMRRPLIRRLVRMDSGRIAGGRTLFAWNDLLGKFPGLVGVKTGHTAAAGWCQVALARRDGVGIYAVVLGSRSRAERNEDLVELLEWGFEQYVRVEVVAPDRTYAVADVPFSDERLALRPAAGARVIVRAGRPLLEEVVAPAVVALPVRRGERLGEIRVREGDRVVARQPLVAAAAVTEPGLDDKAGWYADRAFSEAGEMLSGVFGGVL